MPNLSNLVFNVLVVLADRQTVPYIRHRISSGKVHIWRPGTLKKIRALLSAEGAPLNLLVPLTAVWGPGTLASNF